jgi:basic membrane protein A and related proteins
MGKGVAVIVALLVILGVIFLATPPRQEGGNLPPADKTGANPAQPSKPFKVALVTPGDINDGGWSQNAYAGLKRIEKELGATIKNNVAASANQAFASFREYAGQDMDLIIGHASEWFDPKLIEIADANPKSVFMISGSENVHKNVAGVRFLLEDGCYVLGQLAASMSKSGILGCVGPKEIPVIESTFHAFEQGAKSVRADIKVNIVWTNDWSDVARAKERTLILISQGADIIFHNANDGAPGVFQAVQEHKDKGVLAFGSNADQTSMADDVILASAVLDIPGAYLNLGRKVRDGAFTPEVQYLGMPQGVVWITYNTKLESRIPPAARKLADETAEKIKKGEFKAPRRQLK